MTPRPQQPPGPDRSDVSSAASASRGASRSRAAAAARPADVVRRALRAARREEGDGRGGTGSGVEGDVDRVEEGVDRPGRQAGAGSSATFPARLDDEGGPAPHGDVGETASAPRPGDGARQALRAAQRRLAASGAPAIPMESQSAGESRLPGGPGPDEPADGVAGGSAAPRVPRRSRDREGGPGRIGERGRADAAPAPATGTGTGPELRRTFGALPPRLASPDARFAGTWWGNAWTEALEELSLDQGRLARGRRYAAQGNVGAITVTPGLVLAYVQGSRARPYRTRIALRVLSDDEWDRFLDAAAERPGRIAALLEKDMPHSLADCGVDLLPGPGDLQPDCSCPDFGYPCKHAAALCYQTARLLDEDPFVLLLMRGRGERELLDELSRRNAAQAARPAQTLPPFPGVRARDALTPRTLPPLPAPLPTPPHPEHPPVYPAAPGGPDPFALDQLASDAAARAHALLATGRDPVAELTLWQDAVRLAAARPGSGLTGTGRALYASLASAAGRTPADLARAVAAWRQGGEAGLAALEEQWDPPAGRFDRARPALLAADFPPFRPWHNHLTHPQGHVQLRLGRDGLWYAYESEPGRDDWWPRGTPDLDPVGALTGLLGAGGTGGAGTDPEPD
ncbi:SWIM zinc finger family protein [Streptomyces sp. NPDC002896]|uniref:SWIM zinc finger family protein n=1 Tax=Streptomyces sp. NPDC002896 TaxID=3154438 RepID=UPI003332A3DB